MEIQTILAHCDHTLLAPTATWAQIRQVLDDGMAFGVASACIPPCYVKQAKCYVNGRLPICTVIGFPNGYHTTAAKVAETEDAVANGADEVDMVINVGMLKDGNDAYVLGEIRAVRGACQGKILKVIVETCLLTDEEKVRACRIVNESGADFIKTSTGFGGGGATLHDVQLFAAKVAPHVQIKAAGGIADLSDVEAFLKAGATRLGTSRVVKAAKVAQNG